MPFPTHSGIVACFGLGSKYECFKNEKSIIGEVTFLAVVFGTLYTELVNVPATDPKETRLEQDSWS